MSPIVLTPKKNNKLRVYINLNKVNAATIKDHFPLPIVEHLLEWVPKKEAYRFLDGFSRYKQVTIHPNDQHKIAFANTI